MRKTLDLVLGLLAIMGTMLAACSVSHAQTFPGISATRSVTLSSPTVASGGTDTLTFSVTNNTPAQVTPAVSDTIPIQFSVTRTGTQIATDGTTVVVNNQEALVGSELIITIPAVTLDTTIHSPTWVSSTECTYSAGATAIGGGVSVYPLTVVLPDVAAGQSETGTVTVKAVHP